MVNDINQICINFLLKILFIKFNNEKHIKIEKSDGEIKFSITYS